MRKLWCLLALTCLVGAEPPQTQLMYLSPELELKLAVAIKREHYPWPAMKVGIGQFGQRWFGHIRFFVAPGAGKAQMLRQCRQVSLLTFRMFDKMVQIDIDASPQRRQRGEQGRTMVCCLLDPTYGSIYAAGTTPSELV
jgi:hypothetical protein